MSDEVKLILSICFFVLSMTLFIIIYMMMKRRSRYISEMQNTIEEEIKNYYLNLKIEENLFPYHEKLISGVRYDLLKKGKDSDSTFEIPLKKHYSFFEAKPIYIVNNNLKYLFEFKEVDNKKYIIIDKKIKTLELLVFFDKPSHIMFKYEFRFINGKFEYKVTEEVNDNDKWRWAHKKR